MLRLLFQIAAVANSTEYRLGLNKNAHMKGSCFLKVKIIGKSYK